MIKKIIIPLSILLMIPISFAVTYNPKICHYDYPDSNYTVVLDPIGDTFVTTGMLVGKPCYHDTPCGNFTFAETKIVSVSNGTVFYSNFYLMFDLSSIPFDVEINKVNLTLFTYLVLDYPMNVTIYNTTNDWNEYNLTWDNQPNSTWTYQTFENITVEKYWYFNLLDTAIYQHNQPNQNLSIVFSYYPNSTEKLDYWTPKMFIETKEAIPPWNNIPQLIISYYHAPILVCNNNTYGEYCYTNETLKQRVTLNGVDLEVERDCINGCDFQTNSCNPSPLIQSLMVGGIVLAVIFIGGWIIGKFRR